MIKKSSKTILVTAFILTAAVFNSNASDTALSGLVKSALENNYDLSASAHELLAEIASYESKHASMFPSLGFTSDTGNNPLYKYANEEHKFGGGLNLNISLPTGGFLNIVGAGNLSMSVDELDETLWNYKVSPALSLYLRQPLFIDRLNGYPVRFDSFGNTDELAAAGVKIAELNNTALENSYIILISRTAAVFNSLRDSSNLLRKRIALAEKRLEIARDDEAGGRLNSIERLSEELQINRLKETMIELDFQLKTVHGDLEQLTGKTLVIDEYVDLSDLSLSSETDMNSSGSLDVQKSLAAARITELKALSTPSGGEPALEVSALYRRTDKNKENSFAEAFENIGSAEMGLSVSVALSLPFVDWGEMYQKRESEKNNLLAAEQRLQSAEKTAEITFSEAEENLNLIDKKIELLKQGLSYDQSLLDREIVRFEAGLSREAAVETIRVDLLDREYSIRQLEDQRAIAMLEFYNSGGIKLKELFE